MSGPSRFPETFRWGAATAGHQVEGGNWNSESWLLENLPRSPFAEPSGDACNHYYRYPEDLALIRELGLDSYRFSLEWSRIEPEPGLFSTGALDHYRRVLEACHENGLWPMITFNHFTVPRWFAAAGCWESPDAVDRFARFCERATESLGDLIGAATTLNEPNIAWLLHVSGVLPPGDALVRAPFLTEAARRCGSPRFRNHIFTRFEETRAATIAAHRAAVDAIRTGPGDFPVGWSLAIQDFQALPGGEAACATARREAIDSFLEGSRGDDFIGVQTYSRTRFGAEGVAPPEAGVELTPMGYEFWPEALGGTVRLAFEQTGLPVYVTENGLSNEDDTRRLEYVRRALGCVALAIADGIDVLGYFYWSAFDNFEWTMGYAQRFGIIGVDRATQARRVKPSGRWLGEVARAGGANVA